VKQIQVLKSVNISAGVKESWVWSVHRVRNKNGMTGQLQILKQRLTWNHQAESVEN